MHVSVWNVNANTAAEGDGFRGGYVGCDAELQLRAKFNDPADGQAVEEGGGCVGEGCVVG